MKQRPRARTGASLPGDIEAFFRRVASPTFLTRSDGTIVGWSDAASRALGHQSDHVLGFPCHALFHGRDPFGNRYCVPDCPILQACRAGVTPRPHELALRRADGEYATFRCVVTPVAGDEVGAPFLLYQLFELDFAPCRRDASAQERARPAAAAAAPPLPSIERPPEGGLMARLSEREREVLLLLAEGASMDALADRLRICGTTARNHVQAILRKLGVHSKLEAVVLAFRHGLVS